MDYLILRSKAVRRMISDNQSLILNIFLISPLLPVIDDHKELSVTMVSREDITDMVKYKRRRRHINHNLLEVKLMKMLNKCYHNSIYIL